MKDLFEVDPAFGNQQPEGGGFTAPLTSAGASSPTHIPLGSPFDELAARTAPHHAAGSIMPNFDPPAHFSAEWPLRIQMADGPAFERLFLRSAPLSPIRRDGR